MRTIKCLRHTDFDHTLAREGETAVATVRQFPLDEPATGPLSARAASRNAPSRWPVLARFAEVAPSAELSTAPAVAFAVPSSRPTYRVDASHAAAPNPSHSKAATQAKPRRQPGSDVSDHNDRQDRALDAAPFPVRVAVQTSQLLQPYGAFLRLVAMLGMMVAGGMSLTMMMGHRHGPADTSPPPARAASDHAPAADPAAKAAELQPLLEPANVPNQDTSADEPTAGGPCAQTSEPLVSAEWKAPPVTLQYPTTPYAKPDMARVVGDSLPRAQFSEPAVASRPEEVETTQR
jgi:hypothetical protein